jgi:trehalose utilization protein
MTRVTVWSEFRQAKTQDSVIEHYPDGLHTAIADAMAERGFDTQTAELDEPEHGLDEETLEETDVLLWWGHRAHDDVADEVVDRVQDHVLDGMGFLPLHSSHYSKPFIRLMGTDCSLRWRDVGERERVWVTAPGHPITNGIDRSFEVPEAEMYGEPFDVPAPDQLVFVSWFEGGEIFRSGCAYERGKGRIFYFRPGHEEYPIYYDETIQDVLANAIEWATPREGSTRESEPANDPPEDIE